MDLEEDTTLKKNNNDSIMMNLSRTLFVYENEEFDLIKNSNIPHINVEDNKYWKGYNTSTENPNLLGQIHLINSGVIFDLCYSPQGKKLTKSDLKAIIAGMEYIENFKSIKKNKNKK